MRPLILFLALALAAHAQPNSISLTGTEASESNGDGIAFNIPNLDGISANPDGSFNYNPLSYAPLPITPANPTVPPPAGTTFNIGTITYAASSIPTTGTHFLPITPTNLILSFSDYNLAVGIEVDMRPPTASGSTITLANITGNGLQFENGQPRRLDFTANVKWTPTVNGFNQINIPYDGTLTVVNGTFTFLLSTTGPRDYFRFGAADIEFHFDLIATIPALVAPLPTILPIPEISLHSPGNIQIYIPASQASGNYILQQNPDLTPHSWTNLIPPFSNSTLPRTEIIPIAPFTKRFFRLAEAP